MSLSDVTNSMNAGTSSETALQTKWRTVLKPPQEKIQKALIKWEAEGKEGKKNQKKINEEKQPSHNRFKILEEEDGNNGTNQVLEYSPAEKEKDDNMGDRFENNK